MQKKKGKNSVFPSDDMPVPADIREAPRFFYL